MRFKTALFGVALATAASAQYGCTVADDNADDTTPSAGRSSSTAGSSAHAGVGANGGTADMMSEAGASGSPESSSGGSTSGSGGNSGSAGKSGSGGKGGAGGAGGSSTGHGGSGGGAGALNAGGSAGTGSPSGGATQSAACTTCANTKCNTATTNGCAHIMGTDTAKCQSVLDCIVSQKCYTGTDAGDTTLPCYCGAEVQDMCFFEANASTLTGACTQVIETATGGAIPLQVATIFFDNSTPLGAATQHIECEQQNCKTECF